MFTIEYLLEVSVCWLLFYGVYRIFLSQETHFILNRIYLIFSLLLGLIVPLSLIPTPNVQGVSFIEPLQLSVKTVANQIEATTLTLPSLSQVFWWVYGFGIAFFIGRLLLDFRFIFSIFQKGKVSPQKGYHLVISDLEHPPFSFFNYLFLPKKIIEQETESDKIIAHELAHIKGWHSFDVLLTEVLTIFFWFNPIVYWYKHSIQDIHEYLADAAVTQHTSIKTYGRLLMRQALPDINLSLSNHFNHSQLKKRINMMTKKTSSRWAYIKYALALPTVLVTFLAFSAFDYPLLNNSAKGENTITNDVDEMPRMPGCEDKTTTDEKLACSNTKLITFISQNLEYPVEARKKNIEGNVFISFIVDASGKIKDIEIKKGIGGGCDEAAKTVMQKLQNEVTWIPGKKDGKAVSVEMVLPFGFKLPKEDKK